MSASRYILSIDLGTGGPKVALVGDDWEIAASTSRPVQTERLPHGGVITIAADITKYGDNARRTLFLVYDPLHLVLDEARFVTPIEARPEMMLRFIR